jgi:ubiquinone/menaquinone biosynthesis C-methylase UbiE
LAACNSGNAYFSLLLGQLILNIEFNTYKMKTTDKIKSMTTGKNREYIPNFAFKIMTLIMGLVDLFTNKAGKKIKTLNLKPGQTVIDYGCGPARYVKDASKIVGDSGKVIAIDIHPLAIKKVKVKIKKYGLTNVEAVLASGYKTNISNETADVVYALDMFHMIEQPKELLTELARLIKLNGRVIIEDGHQPRTETKLKIENAKILRIVCETKLFVECKKM